MVFVVSESMHICVECLFSVFGCFEKTTESLCLSTELDADSLDMDSPVDLNSSEVDDSIDLKVDHL